MRAKNPPKNRSPYIKVVIDAIDFDRSKRIANRKSYWDNVIRGKKSWPRRPYYARRFEDLYRPSTKTCGYDGGYDQIIMAKKPDGDFFRSSFCPPRPVLWR